MEHIHFNRDIPADVDHLPVIEEELRSIHRDFQEIQDTLVQRQSKAVKNAIFSALFLLGGILGTQNTKDTGNNPNAFLNTATGIISIAGLVGTGVNVKRVIHPENFYDKIRIEMLQEERESLLRLSSEIRHSTLSS